MFEIFIVFFGLPKTLLRLEQTIINQSGLDVPYVGFGEERVDSPQLIYVIPFL